MDKKGPRESVFQEQLFSPTDEKKTDKKREPESEGSFWSRCHDRWFFVFFILNITLYTILSAYTIFELITNYDDIKDEAKLESNASLNVNGEDLDKAFTKTTAVVFMGATGLSLVLSFCLLIFIYFLPGFVIRLGPVLAVIFFLGSATGMIFAKAWGSAVILGFAGIVVIAAMWVLRKKYKLAIHLLATANKGAKAHKSVFLVVIIGLIVEGLNSLWNLFTFVAVVFKFTPTGDNCQKNGMCSSGLVIGLLIFVLLSHLWTSSVIGSVVIMTLAGGPYARWWKDEDKKGESECWYAFKKSMSISLGSVAFGSLLVGLVEVLCFTIKMVTVELVDSSVCNYCCAWLVNILNALFNMFNKYVYIKIGVDDFAYGYKTSAKNIVYLIRKKKKDERVGVNAMICDSIVGFSLNTTCVACALICAALTYLWSAAINETMKLENWWDWLIIVYSFILALNIGLVLTSALEAGVSTILLLLDKFPDKVETKNPEFYQALQPDRPLGGYEILKSKPGEV